MSEEKFDVLYNKFEDIELHNVLDDPFVIEGLYMPKETGVFTRLPMEFMDRNDINDTAKIVMTNTAGGCIRFITDSPYIALCVVLGERSYILHHMADTGVKGFDMYCREADSDDEPHFAKIFIPDVNGDEKEYSGSYEFMTTNLREVTVNFPLYHNVDKVLIGLKKNCTLKEAAPHKFSKPIVFYGSSITQGACASRPGMAYPSILGRRINCGTVNLGFSGAGQGEQMMAEYIADMDMSAFVMDYDHNALSVEHLERTHYPFYETIRRKQPDLPIIMMSAPVSMLDDYNPIIPAMKKRRMIIMESYIKAVRAGDNNLYFVDGVSLLGTDKPYDSTVDGNHPNDYGFCQMADILYPILRRLLCK